MILRDQFFSYFFHSGSQIINHIEDRIIYLTIVGETNLEFLTGKEYAALYRT